MARNLYLVALLAICSCLSTQANGSVFHSFVIRDGTSGSPGINTNNDYVPGATEFDISEGGMKAGWGSDDINGFTIGGITQLSITRHDDTTRFTGGSGPAVAPYFNIWVTDGLGKYAVIANEPSNPAFQPLFTSNIDSKTYDLSYSDLMNQTAKVYETPGWNTNGSWIHNMFGPDPLTFGELASLEIAPPPPAYLQNGNGTGSGAPDELTTNTAYGFNWVFGDTLSNYANDAEGYVVSNPSAAAQVVPEPSTYIVFTGLILCFGLASWWRKRRQLAA